MPFNVYRRREEVQRVRAEGAAAFRAGKSPQTNPYRYANQMQWWTGYEDARHEAEAEASDKSQEDERPKWSDCG